MKPVKILLVEDNQGDVLLTKEALIDGEFANELIHLPDGELALKYLNKLPPYEQAETPDLVLLDINMPKVGGFEVLKQVKHSAELKKIPIIMLTTSSSEEDIRRAYDSYANAYLTKPVAYSDFIVMVESIKNFWLKSARLPRNAR